MYHTKSLFSTWTVFLTLIAASVHSDNQTSTVTEVLDPDSLPYSISIEEASLALPLGIHSGVYAQYEGKWLFFMGRTNGMHGFGVDPFPPLEQNVTVIVVDFPNGQIYTRNLDDAGSGLSQEQIDTLSVTSPQFFQNGKTLYVTGGYGVDTASGEFETKSVLTAVDIPKLISWTMNPSSNTTALSAIRQTSSSWIQVTGGYMASLDNHLSTLLIFGQNFVGTYTPSSNGVYTQQIRRLQIIDNQKDLYVQKLDSESPNPSYRRRDLNIVPIIQKDRQAFVALSGVFTLTDGIWTVPVEIDAEGNSSMANPSSADSFKQAMNNYISATASLYSPSTDDNYQLLLGGITYGYFNGGSFELDTSFPFTNQVTTVKRDGQANYSQYIMEGEYPFIASTGTNPGNELLFGAGAYFLNSTEVPQYRNGVINLDKISGPTVIGYIVGGIMSTVPNTATQADSTASPYIFRVILTPKSLP